METTVYRPTNSLRWLQTEEKHKVFFRTITRTTIILQQLYVADNGKWQWNNIEVVKNKV